jgi:hypothetical protein
VLQPEYSVAGITGGFPCGLVVIIISEVVR